MNRYWWRAFETTLLFLVLTLLAACATIKINPITAPPPTAKLRVYVQPLTGEGKWKTPHEVYVQNQVRRVERFLEKTGIYDVVGEHDVRSVLGDQQMERRKLEQDGWALARRLGAALHADYVMVMERVKQRGAVGGADFLFVTVMINVGTGKVFESRTQLAGMTPGDREEQRELMRLTYRNIFQSCMQDMLATAVQKGRAGPPAPLREPSVVNPEPPAVPAPKQMSPTSPEKLDQKTATPAAPGNPAPTAPSKETISPPAVNGEVYAAPALKQEKLPDLSDTGLIERQKKDGSAKKIVVYDFEVTDQYRTVALILAEALREEVFKLKQFVLVNREDLQKVLEEMALQQTGLIDEKDAVKTGRGLAANQVVTGRIGQLGRIFVMQAKRVDVESFGTLGLASLKFTEGQEDEVMNKLPEFARDLVGY